MIQSSKEVSAFAKNVSRNAQAAYVFRCNLLKAFLHFCTDPQSNLAMFLKLFLVTFPMA